MLTQTNLPKQSAGSCTRDLSRTAPRMGHSSSHPNVSDNALIKAIALGDRQAMELLYSRHNVRVYRFSLRITGNATLAEDIVSEVFLDVWRRADGFKANSQVSTWLLAIARNKSLSAVRRRVDAPLDDERWPRSRIPRMIRRSWSTIRIGARLSRSACRNFLRLSEK